MKKGTTKGTMKISHRSTALLALTAAIAFGGPALAATRTLKVSLTNTAGKPVPVSFSLVQVRDTIGSEFATSFASLRVMSGTTAVPYQIDDVDGNGRVSAGDEMSFLAAGPVTIMASDDASAQAPNYAASLTTAAGADGLTVITSRSTAGFMAEIAKTGLARITGLGSTKAVLADEIGNLRFSGFPNSTFYKDKKLGNHEEKTTLDGMTLLSSKVLPAGAVRVVAVSRYSSPLFIGLEQTVVSRVYASGAVDVSSTVTFRGYADMMKLLHQTTRVMTEADPQASHIAPLFRRVAYADLLKTTPQAFYAAADRKATLAVGSRTNIVFPASANLKNPFWGGSYLFASPEAYRSNYSAKLRQGVAEIAYGTPALASNYQNFIGGDQWQLESGEFRTGLFKWLPDELKPVSAIAPVFTNPDGNVSHFYPGDTKSWRYLYDAYSAASAGAAADYLAKRSADLASVKLSK